MTELPLDALLRAAGYEETERSRRARARPTRSGRPRTREEYGYELEHGRLTGWAAVYRYRGAFHFGWFSLGYRLRPPRR